MMKNKKAYIATVSIALIVLVSGAVFWSLNQNRLNEKGHDLPTSQEDNVVNDKNQPLANGSPANQDKSLTPTQPSTSTQDIEKPTITRAEMSGDYIRVSAIFSKPSNGTCLLELKKVGQSTYSESAEITVGPSYYTCNGFRVPRSKLSSGGEWTATVSHIINGQSVASDAKTVTVP